MGCCVSSSSKQGSNDALAITAAAKRKSSLAVNPTFDSGSCDPADFAVSVHHLCTVLRPRVVDKLAEIQTQKASSDLDDVDVCYDKIEDMVKWYIKPCTKSQKSSYVDHVRAGIDPQSDTADDHYGKAGAMLSYTWKYNFLDVISSLDLYTEKSGQDPKRTYIWICCLCVNQHDMEKSEESPAALFENKIISINTLLPLLTPWQNPLYIKRLWCLFELMCAVENKCKVEFFSQKMM